MTPLILVLAGLFLAEAAAGSETSPGEARLLVEIDRNIPAALELLERAVDQNSGTMNFEGVRATGRLFASGLEELGFAVHWKDGAAWGRAGHLTAERRGARAGRTVLLIGHLDTVFEPDSPFQRFERLSETRARGPGIIDMKGGNVIMLLALRALAAAGALEDLEVHIFLGGDEEKPGTPLDLARAELVELARGADVALGFEDGDGDPRTAVVSRRGTSRWILRTGGTPAHSSLIFRDDVGSGAIFEAARILAAFHDTLAGEPYLTFNPGSVVGGTMVQFDPEQSRGTAFGKTNVVAENAVVAGDLRSLSFDQRDRAKRIMTELVSAHLPGTDGRIEFEDQYPPLDRSEGNLRLLALYDAVSRDLGFGPVGPVDPAKAGAADISFTAGIVPMALDGIGLMGEGGHTVHEEADLSTLAMQAKRAAVLLARIAAGD